jgi:hypothetical protein
VPSARAGHNRFVWNLRYPAPRARESEYAIAALPGRPTPIDPQGAYVLPGSYEVRLTVDGTTLHQPLTVAMDPRVDVSTDALRALLGLQTEVAEALARSAELAEAKRGYEARLRAALQDPRAKSARREIDRGVAEIGRAATTREEDPERVNEVLTRIATDLEAIDAAPVEPQRQVVALYRAALGRFEARWRPLAAGLLNEIGQHLDRLGVPAPSAENVEPTRSESADMP